MNTQERINFYLGKDFVEKKEELSKDHLDGVETLDLENSSALSKLYDVPFYNLLLKTDNLDKKFKLKNGDNQEKIKFFTLCKNRFASSQGVILRSLAFKRHWKNFYNRPEDIHYIVKKDKVFWRGATTGQEDYTGNRFDLVKRWCNKSRFIDVGFSHICQNKDNYIQYFKGVSFISQFLDNKFILSIRGNDKDSGLQWKLNSNSVVIMPKPRITSWLMEDKLIPNYHYILVKDDFSDLERIIKLCICNPYYCMKVIKNARKFMSQFSDKQKEEEIEIEVINKYFKSLE